jgi:hypothetical protein
VYVSANEKAVSLNCASLHHGHPLPPFGRVAVAGGEEVIDDIDLTGSDGPALDVLEVE